MEVDSIVFSSWTDAVHWHHSVLGSSGKQDKIHMHEEERAYMRDSTWPYASTQKSLTVRTFPFIMCNLKLWENYTSFPFSLCLVICPRTVSGSNIFPGYFSRVKITYDNARVYLFLCFLFFYTLLAFYVVLWNLQVLGKKPNKIPFGQESRVDLRCKSVEGKK